MIIHVADGPTVILSPFIDPSSQSWYASLTTAEQYFIDDLFAAIDEAAPGLTPEGRERAFWRAIDRQVAISTAPLCDDRTQKQMVDELIADWLRDTRDWYRDGFRALISDGSVLLSTIGAIGLIFGGAALAPHLSDAAAALMTIPVAGYIWYFLGYKPEPTPKTPIVSTVAPAILPPAVLPTIALDTTRLTGRLDPTRSLEDGSVESVHDTGDLCG